MSFLQLTCLYQLEHVHRLHQQQQGASVSVLLRLMFCAVVHYQEQQQSLSVMVQLWPEACLLLWLPGAAEKHQHVGGAGQLEGGLP